MLVGTVDNCHFAEDHKQLKQHYAGEEVMEAVAMSNFVLGTLYEGKTNLAIKWEKDLVKSLHHYQKVLLIVQIQCSKVDALGMSIMWPHRLPPFIMDSLPLILQRC